MQAMMVPSVNQLRATSKLSALLLAFWIAASSHALSSNRELAWHAADIGSHNAPAAAAFQGKVTLNGFGAGIDAGKGDALRFVSTGIPAERFEIRARLTEASLEPGAVAGIMVRSTEDPKSRMCSVGYEATKSALNIRFRVPASPPSQDRLTTNGIELAHQPGEPAVSARHPLWLRLVKIGRNFAAFKSRDGHNWVSISNNSGGPADFPRTVRVGVFVSSPDASKVSRCTFDTIYVGQPQLRTSSAWVGNTFSSTESDNHVSNGLSAMWVAADGTCYTSSYWDEGGQPCTSYRDGHVLRGLPIGTPQTAEGGITGDSRYVYVAAVDQIMRLDPSTPDFSPFAMPFSESLLDKKKNACVVSGMASNGKELYVADSQRNRIKVAKTETVHTYQKAMAANDGIAIAPGPVEVPAGSGYAPQALYQSQRVGEGVNYSIPGFEPGKVYTVRFHMAEFVNRKPDCDPRNRYNYVSIGHPAPNVVSQMDLDPIKLSGAVMRACFKEMPGFTATAAGTVDINIGSYGGPGICGLEILDTAGHRLKGINCGGVSLPGFEGESQELPDRGFAFERPGPMAFDRRGDLWIIQLAREYPVGPAFSPPFKASVHCVHPDGTPTGRIITDVVNPRAIAYDIKTDRLLIAESGPDLNIRIYTRLSDHPVCSTTFGQKGGIFSGTQPGAVRDPITGSMDRFAALSGAGIDSRGCIYVGGGFQGTDLRCFAPSGALKWDLHSLVFTNTYDFDPGSDGTELYTTFNHVHLDFKPGSTQPNQQYKAYMWDWRRYGEPERADSSQAIVHRFGESLVMVTTGQGNIGEIKIFRKSGELFIPAGGICDSGASFWTDKNGDGIMQPSEKEKMGSPLNPTGVQIDSHGDIWAMVTSTAGSFLRHFKLHGITAQGVPIYGAKPGSDYDDIPLPEEGGKVNGWGMASRFDYDRDRDMLIAMFPVVPRKGENDMSPPQYKMARYDHFLAGGRTPKWKIHMGHPVTDPDLFMYEVNPFPYCGYMGMQCVGEYVFCAYLFGEVHVFNAQSGKLEQIICPGPEINGQTAWEDASMGLRATKRKNGEYLILLENSGWGGKNNLYRWKPEH